MRIPESRVRSADYYYGLKNESLMFHKENLSYLRTKQTSTLIYIFVYIERM